MKTHRTAVKERKESICVGDTLDFDFSLFLFFLFVSFLFVLGFFYAEKIFYLDSEILITFFFLWLKNDGLVTLNQSYLFS